MRICIIGWYGTETIGDRAILAGLISIFGKIFGAFSISIGSLYPHFTRRTILEDEEFYLEISDNKLSHISIFDSLDRKQLKFNIKESNILILGGGPLMDIDPMYMLDFAFRYAKKHNIKTSILGCGWGPLNNEKFQVVAYTLIGNSDLTIFRDSTSSEQYMNYCSSHNLRDKEVYCSIDPAFFCAQFYKEKYPQKDSGFVSVNFRDVSLDQYGGNEEKNEFFFKTVLTKLSELSMPIHLVPMHTFHIGGDDRELLNRLYLMSDDLNMIVHNDPPSLVEVMELYRNSNICVGMRFHSIVLQTILSGKNIIIDYTNPKSGKIISMMRELGMGDEYKNRYCSLLDHSGNISFDLDFKFNINGDYLLKKENIYLDNLKLLINQ